MPRPRRSDRCGVRPVSATRIVCIIQVGCFCRKAQAEDRGTAIVHSHRPGRLGPAGRGHRVLQSCLARPVGRQRSESAHGAGRQSRSPVAKCSYGADIVFWGGGVISQRTLPFGAPNRFARRCCGFAFTSIHNVQAKTAVENGIAMINAVHEFHGGKASNGTMEIR